MTPDKSLCKLQVTRNFFNLIKGIYEKSTTNVKLYGGRMIKARASALPVSTQFTRDGNQCNKEGEEIKGIWSGKGRRKTVFFPEGKIIYVRGQHTAAVFVNIVLLEYMHKHSLMYCLWLFSPNNREKLRSCHKDCMTTSINIYYLAS